MSNKWNRWSNLKPVFQHSDVLDLLYIDSKNDVLRGTELAGSVAWHNQHRTILAWRLVAPVIPEPAPDRLLGVRYWNWEKAKFWPAAAVRPPNPSLPYFRIEIWQLADGTTQLKHILPVPASKPHILNRGGSTETEPDTLA